MRTVLVVVQYDGTDYHGFQRQPGLLTVQLELEQALSRLLSEEVSIVGAGRTDAGVHALGQVVTVETASPVPTEKFVSALNGLLSQAIAVVDAREMPEGFHPRYDAVGKLYRYRILNRRLPCPFAGRYAWHMPRSLDVSSMEEAAGVFLGRHDFVAFSSSGSGIEDTVRDLRRLEIERDGEIVEIRVEADGFLYMMMRRIVGALVDIGVEAFSIEELQAILQSRDRCRCRTVAPPQGLSLIKVIY